jgi:F-type H+-transporting ATPase subunit a
MIALVPLLVPAVFLGLEAIFGFVQALVFALLTMTYITMSIAEHQGAGHGHEGEHPDNPQHEQAPNEPATVNA